MLVFDASTELTIKIAIEPVLAPLDAHAPVRNK